jgi:hypothetical protein
VSFPHYSFWESDTHEKSIIAFADTAPLRFIHTSIPFLSTAIGERAGKRDHCVFIDSPSAAKSYHEYVTLPIIRTSRKIEFDDKGRERKNRGMNTERDTDRDTERDAESIEHASIGRLRKELNSTKTTLASIAKKFLQQCLEKKPTHVFNDSKALVSHLSYMSATDRGNIKQVLAVIRDDIDPLVKALFNSIPIPAENEWKRLKAEIEGIA